MRIYKEELVTEVVTEDGEYHLGSDAPVMDGVVIRMEEVPKHLREEDEVLCIHIRGDHGNTWIIYYNEDGVEVEI